MPPPPSPRKMRAYFGIMKHHDPFITFIRYNNTLMSELISSGGSLGGTIKLPQVWVNFHDLYQWWKKRLVFAIGRDVFSWELRYPFLYKPPLKMLFPFPRGRIC